MLASREDAGTAHFPASSVISSLMEGPSWQFNSLEKPAQSGCLSAPSTQVNPLKNLCPIREIMTSHHPASRLPAESGYPSIAP